jgi:hypothetical protein
MAAQSRRIVVAPPPFPIIFMTACSWRAIRRARSADSKISMRNRAARCALSETIGFIEKGVPP